MQKKKIINRKKGKLPKKTIVLMVCKDHKIYNATYPPKIDCIVCWKIYATSMLLINKALRRKLKELKNAQKR